MTRSAATARPASSRPSSRVQARWVWLFVAVLGLSQLLFIPHEYTHPVLGSDGACKICLLSSSVTPPAQRLAPAPPQLFPPVLALATRAAATQSVAAGASHPRAPPAHS